MEEAELLCDEIAIMDRGRIIAPGRSRQLLREHFAEVLLELPKQEFSRGAPSLGRCALFEAGDRIEITTDDLDGTLRTLMDAQVPLTNLRIRHRILRTSSWNSPARSYAHDEAAPGGVGTREISSSYANRGTLLFTLVVPIALVVGMGIVFGGPERALSKSAC